jgi:DNA helicase-2/ATP-dependent DNA helicase PcrA
VLFLSALKVFRDALRAHEIDHKQSNQILKTCDLIRYVDLLQKRNIRLVDNSVYNSSKEAVNLLTAHKSKGMDFEHVFVIECSESTWNGRGKSNKIGLPTNLPLLPQSNTNDDSLRLFYVSITRAKKYLYLTHYQSDSNGGAILPLSFLNDVVKFEDQNLGGDSLDYIQGLQHKDEEKLPDGILPLTIWFQGAVKDSLAKSDLSEYLAPMLENYKLSVTHLNSFLDLVRGGPAKFIQQNILHFPQAKSPAAAYGTAMHASIKDFYSYFQSIQKIPGPEYLIDRFKFNLQTQRLIDKDYRDYLEKGSENLKIYYDNRAQTFSIKDRLEEDFNTQGVVLGKNENEYGAKITGKIDKMIFGENSQIEVVDFKTGKAHTKWTDSNLDTAVKLQNYRRQLVFYKLLVENSKDFSKYTVNMGSLEFLDVAHNDTQTKILKTEITAQESQELSKLIQVVYKKIVGLAKGESLPDTSIYSSDLKGIEGFIQDLMSE